MTMTLDLALLVAIAIGLATAIGLSAMVKLWSRPTLIAVTALAIGVRLIAGFGRYRSVFSHDEPNRHADAYRYVMAGVERAESGGHLGAPPLTDGTAFTEWLAHVLAGALWPDAGALYVIAGFLAFAGAVLLTRSFAIVLGPRGAIAGAAAFLLFPPIVWWGASFGKESLHILALGCIAYGSIALAKTPKRSMPFSLLVLGAAVLWLLRPQAILLLIVSIGVAVILGSEAYSGPRDAGPQRAVLRVASAALLLTALSAADEFLPSEADGAAALLEDLSSRSERTSVGASVLDEGIGRRFAMAWFRPLPWQVRDVGDLIASTEGVLYFVAMVILLVRWRATVSVIRTRMGLLLATYAVGVWVVIAGHSNLGLLIRIRSIGGPALILLAFVVASHHARYPFNSKVRMTAPSGTHRPEAS